MESNIITRKVDFMGDILMAAQDENKQVWVGVRWVCEGIGFTEGQRKRVIANIQEYIVLSKGGSNLILPTKGGNQAVLCLMIDFLPLWLAKISITPKMKDLTPHVAEKLVAYQLKAKDVLAAAFLPQYIQPKIEAQPNMSSMLNQFYCCLESSLRSELKVRFNEAIPSIMQMLTLSNTPTGFLVPEAEIGNKTEALSTLPVLLKCPKGQDWKQWVYYMIDTYLMVTQLKQTRKEVLSNIYTYLCKNYGMVSDQLVKEYRDKCHHQGRASTINMIEINKDWRRIFDSVLCDKVNNATIQTSSCSNFPALTETVSVQNREESPTEECNDLLSMITELISSRNDTTIHGGATYRAIYKRMYTSKQWNYKTAGYKRKMGVSMAPNRITIVLSNEKLKKECTDVVVQMLLYRCLLKQSNKRIFHGERKHPRHFNV